MQRANLILNLFNERRLTDVTFVVENEEVKVHKAILAAECSYFNAMLFGATNEANATRITLNETPLKQFKEVIRFCYLKHVNIDGWSTEDVCNLISLAHEYNCDSLMEEIVKEMAEQTMLNQVSFPAFFDLAVKLNSEQVFKVIEECVLPSDVESEEFVGYSADLVCFVFKVVPLTPLTIEALWKWKASHTDQEVEQVFNRIRWETVNPKILAEVIRVLVPQTNLSKVAKPELGGLVHQMDGWGHGYGFDGEAADWPS